MENGSTTVKEGKWNVVAMVVWSKVGKWLHGILRHLGLMELLEINIFSIKMDLLLEATVAQMVCLVRVVITVRQDRELVLVAVAGMAVAPVESSRPMVLVAVAPRICGLQSM